MESTILSAGVLVPIYRELAADGLQFRGLSILTHRATIQKLVRRHGAQRLLDYGSGAGDAWRSPHRLHKDLRLHWWDVVLYDPAFPEHEEEPTGMFDGVLCSDVLEHVPEGELDAMIERLYSHARRFLWASVCCRLAKKKFPDGTNMHVTIHKLPWWRDLFEKHRPKDREIDVVLSESP